MKAHLRQADDIGRQKEGEIKRLESEKSELKEDLLKRDRDYLDLEENVFKLEMAKVRHMIYCVCL